VDPQHAAGVAKRHVAREANQLTGRVPVQWIRSRAPSTSLCGA
jgi:hypothetical protein